MLGFQEASLKQGDLPPFKTNCPLCQGEISFDDGVEEMVCPTCGKKVSFEEAKEALRLAQEPTVNALMETISKQIEDGDFEKAKVTCDQSLSLMPYAGLLHVAAMLVQYRFSSPEQLPDVGPELVENEHYRQAIRYLGKEDREDLLRLGELAKKYIRGNPQVITPSEQSDSGQEAKANNEPKEEKTPDNFENKPAKPGPKKPKLDKYSLHLLIGAGAICVCFLAFAIVSFIASGQGFGAGIPLGIIASVVALGSAGVATAYLLKKLVIPTISYLPYILDGVAVLGLVGLLVIALVPKDASPVEPEPASSSSLISSSEPLSSEESSAEASSSNEESSYSVVSSEPSSESSFSTHVSSESEVSSSLSSESSTYISSESSEEESSVESSEPISSEISSESSISSVFSTSELVTNSELKAKPSLGNKGKLSFTVTSGEDQGDYDLILPALDNTEIYDVEEITKPTLDEGGTGLYSLKVQNVGVYAQTLLDQQGVVKANTDTIVTLDISYLVKALSPSFSDIANVTDATPVLDVNDADIQAVGFTAATYLNKGEFSVKVDAGAWQGVYGLILPSFNDNTYYQDVEIPASRDHGSFTRRNPKGDNVYDLFGDLIYGDWKNSAGKALYKTETHGEKELAWFKESFNKIYVYLAFFSGGLYYDIAGSVPKFSEQLKYTTNDSGEAYVSGIKSAYASTLEVIDIPDEVTISETAYKVVGINDGAFKDNTNIKQAYFGKNLTGLGAAAFKGCTSLENVELSEDEGAKNIDIHDNAFAGCTALKEVKGIARARSIDEHAFDGDVKLTALSFSEGLEDIGASAFEGCTGLTTVAFSKVPDGKNLLIGAYAFEGCTALKKLDLCADYGGGTVEMSEHAFANCSALEELIGTRRILKASDYAFENCANLEGDLLFTSVCTYIGKRAFANCPKITSVDFSDSPVEIGAEAFAEDTGITDVDFGTKALIIGDRAFFNCTGLEARVLPIKYPASLTKVGTAVFGNVSITYKVDSASTLLVQENGIIFAKATSGSKWNVVKAADKGLSGSVSLGYYDTDTFDVYEIEAYAFAKQTSLKSILFGSVLLHMGEYAFAGCTDLMTCDLSKSRLNSIPDGAFRGCSYLSYIAGGTNSSKFAGGATNFNYIGEYAFAGTYMSGLDISAVKTISGVQIGNHAFDSCPNLAFLSLPKLRSATLADPATLGRDIFANCPKFTVDALKVAMTKDAFDKDATTRISGTGTWDHDGDSSTPEVDWHWWDCLDHSVTITFSDPVTKNVWKTYGGL